MAPTLFLTWLLLMFNREINERKARVFEEFTTVSTFLLIGGIIYENINEVTCPYFLYFSCG